MKTTNKNMFREREQALENEFFFRLDKQLLHNLRQQLEEGDAKMALARAGHISGEALLDELVELGVTPESLAAVHLIPLVVVAWANQQVAEKERLTVLQAAAEQGIEKETPAYELLERWLRTEPTESLFTAWRHYIQELSGRLTPDAVGTLRDGIIARARAVAKAADGILGFGRIGHDEKQVLEQLADAFPARR